MLTTERHGLFRWLVKMPAFDGSQHCASVGDMFYSEDDMSSSDVYQQNQAAKRVCQGCPFFDTCRTYALAHERYGVWGGTTGNERVGMRKTLRLAVTSPDEIHMIFPTHTNITQKEAI